MRINFSTDGYSIALVAEKSVAGSPEGVSSQGFAAVVGIAGAAPAPYLV